MMHHYQYIDFSSSLPKSLINSVSGLCQERNLNWWWLDQLLLVVCALQYTKNNTAGVKALGLVRHVQRGSSTEQFMS